MVDTLVKHKQLKAVMINQVQEVHKLSEDWNLTRDERFNLYIKCAKALDGENDTTGAFKIYYEAIKIVDTKNSISATDREKAVSQMLVQAIKSPEIINFEEIMLL